MGRYSISRKAWQTATNILLYYPDNKREYASLLDTVLAPDKPETGTVQHSGLPDPTSSAAIRLANSRRAERLKAEIEAVEMAVSQLSDPEREVISRRFLYRQTKRRRKPKPYDQLFDIPYSEREMHRIVQKTISLIAQYVGEI